MVTLLVLAWMFPGVRWLEPFRARRPPRRPQASARAPDLDFIFTSNPRGVADSAPMTAVETRLADRRSASGRMSGVYAGATLAGTGVLLFLGASTLAGIVSLGSAGRTFVTVVAAIMTCAGALVVLSAIRSR